MIDSHSYGLYDSRILKLSTRKVLVVSGNIHMYCIYEDPFVVAG